MDVEENVTVTKLDLQGERCYLLIGWQTFSFEMYLYRKDKLWKGIFSSSRLTGFSRNLQMTEEAYFKSLRSCLSRKREDYRYEIKSGFFYWKRILKETVIMEGFLPIEVDTSPKKAQPDLIEVLMALNNESSKKANNLLRQFQSLKLDYQKCLKDTEEFLQLKVEMEKALCDKFVNLLSIQKTRMETFIQDAAAPK